MPARTLVVLGSGPGIGVAIASAFAVRGFTHIALLSRDATRLSQDEDTVLTAIQERGYTSRVQTWAVDLCDTTALKAALSEIQSFGSVECVLFNAARVAGKPLLEESVDDVARDFATTNLALYVVACWALPLLLAKKEELGGGDAAFAPSLFVTSTSQLYKQPHPVLFSLSMVKTAQRNLVQALHAKYGEDVHVALLSVGGIVAPDKEILSPANIADQAWALYKQPKSQWKFEIEIAE